MTQDYTPPPPVEVLPPIESVPAPKKNNNTIWIIVAVVVVLLCCRCLVIAGVFVYNNYDKWVASSNSALPLLYSLL